MLGYFLLGYVLSAATIAAQHVLRGRAFRGLATTTGRGYEARCLRIETPVGDKELHRSRIDGEFAGEAEAVAGAQQLVGDAAAEDTSGEAAERG